MWLNCPYLPNNKAWIEPSKKTLKRRKQRKNKRMANLTEILYTPTSSSQDLWNITYLGSTPVQPTTAAIPAQKKKKGKPMSYDCDCDYDAPTVENRKLSYVQNRVDSIQWNKRQDLRKMFRLDEASPSNGEELLNAIKDGKFTLLTEKEIRDSGRYIYNVLSYFKWRAPDDKPDQTGYDLAEKELDKIGKDTTDIVTLGDYAQQLEALKAFSGWQPSNKPA